MVKQLKRHEIKVLRHKYSKAQLEEYYSEDNKDIEDEYND